MIVKKLAISPISARSPSREAPRALAEDRLEPVEERRRRRADLCGAAADAGVQEQDARGEHDQRREPPDRGTGDVAFRIVGFLGGQWQLLDREVEPDREGQSGENACDALRQEATAALLRWDVGEQAAVEGATDENGHEEECEDGERQQGYHHGEPHGDLDAHDVDPDEDDVVDRPPQHRAVPPPVGARHVEDDVVREEAHRADDHRGGDHVLHVLRQPGDEAAPRAHRRAREGVGAAGVRQGG